ncbi:hypothetical protein Fmac_031227 [Flemingia macrophylla]|uniref:AAA+ ATPase domain-containing protein n=1 Tax=Flemingia macrophylla TaxID=520843 RepID=A0ABD1L1I0_9FABA
MVDIRVAKIAKYMMDPISHHAQYLGCFNNFTENFLNAKKELELTEEFVKERVNTAIDRAETIVPTVNDWLKVVDKVLIEVKDQTKRISKINKSCFIRQCKYFLAKKIERETENMIRLKLEGNFKSISIITEYTCAKYYSSKDFVPFKSTEYNDLLEVLKDNNACMIGLVGMRGSGKTTLAKEVGKEVKELKIFENVVIATVSKTPNIISIQAQIADKLGLKLEEESDECRAQRLSQRLMMETTLLILDDVWEKLDFEALGIPLKENNNKGCRVLLTTHDRELCASMQCQSIKLDILTNEEAWILFKSHAHIINESSNALNDVGKKIVDKCKGLPIAIVMIGSTLRGKIIEEWELTLLKLERLTSPYGCFQVSYDNLTDELAKSLFLMCMIFPEDHEIDLEDLFRFGWGQGLFETSGTMEKAMKEFHKSVNILRDSFLLLHANKEKVKMHDMVREVALRITSERDQTILASNLADSRMSIEDENIKDKKAIYIRDLKNGPVPNDDHLISLSPSLQILVLQSLKVGLEESNASLKRLKMLKILAFLTHVYHWYQIPSLFTLSLPHSLGSLENLHTLCLRGYKLRNISILESLHALEILDLRGSSFEELPEGIVAFKNLKLVDLYDCQIIKNNAFKVTKGCLQLEELYLCPFEEDIIPHNVSFLSRLHRYVLQYSFARYSLLSNYSGSYSLSKALYLKGFISSRMDDFISRVEYLCLVNVEGGYKNLIPSMDPKGMNKLNDLKIYDCEEIECLFDSTSVDLLQTKTVFTNLASLSMHSLYSLHKVFNDPYSRCSLKNLREFGLGNCPKLASLFMSSIAQTLEKLEVLNIHDCSELKHIIEEVEEGNADYFPKLRSLDIRNCKELEYIFPVSFTRGLAKLEKVNIRDNCNLKYVFGNEREHHHQTHIQITLLSLYRLHLHSLPNLIYLWPYYCSSSLPNLKVLEYTDCPRLFDSSMCKVINFSELQQQTATMEKEIIPLRIDTTFNQLCDQMISSKFKAVPKFDRLELSHLRIGGFFKFQMEELGSNREPLNMDLRDFLLMNLLELNFIWKGPTNFLTLPKLQKICVKGCPKLKTIFSPTIVKSLPGLIDIQISDCDELEQVFDIGDAQDHNTLQTPSQQVCFPNIDLVQVEKCNKLKCLFYNFVTGHFPWLRTLEIKECSQLEKIFAFDDQEETSKQSKQLSHLTTIRLTSLPNFNEIHHGFEAYVIEGIINKTNFEEIINDCPIYSSRKTIRDALRVIRGRANAIRQLIALRELRKELERSSDRQIQII